MSDENVDSPQVWDDMNEEEPTPEELAEAARLVRAMDGAPGDELVNEATMATASLLAYSGGSAELGEDRADAVLADVLKFAKRPANAAEKAPDKAASRRWWRFLAPLPFAAAAAAVFLAMNPSSVLLPTPSLSLIEAQARAAGGEEAERLDDEMGNYRIELYAALEEGY